MSLRYPLEKTVEQLLGAWLFSQVHRLGCLLRERISLVTLSFYNVISKSLHTRTFCPWRKQKKNLLLSIWPLTPTHASGLFSKPFWLYLRISWDHFSSGCVSLVWTPLLAVLHQLRVCVCGLHCRVRARCAQSQIVFARLWHTQSLIFTPPTANFCAWKERNVINTKRRKRANVHQHVCSCQSEITFSKPFLARKTLSFSQWQQWSPRASCDSPPRKG